MNIPKTKYNLIIVLGPTATGKTQFAANLAHALKSEIISADSRQVYRKMDLGTGKDYDDYTVAGNKIPVHLIDIHDPGYKYNVYEFQQDFIKAFRQIQAQNKVPILCGGTGMYIEAVSQAYSLIAVPVNEKLRAELESKSMEELEEVLASFKKLHNKSDSDTKKRIIRAIEIEQYYTHSKEEKPELPEIHPVYIGMYCDRDRRRDRITRRLRSRLKEGMIEEVQQLLNEGVSAEDLVYYGLEYKFITQYLTGEMEYEQMVEKLNIAIHQFAKRQTTWFRKMERQGTEIFWIESELEMKEKVQLALNHIGENFES